MDALTELQGSVGNAAVVEVLRRVGRIRPEEEHRHGDDCAPGEEPAVQRRSAVHDVLRTGGKPLDGPTRADAEARLGADFGGVRLHEGRAAKNSAAEIGARAYTSGEHVVIGDGGADKRTLYHELTHVVQQRQGPVAGTDNGAGLSLSHPSDRFEREAEANAARALAAGPVPAQRAEADPAAHSSPADAGSAVQRAPLRPGTVRRPDSDEEMASGSGEETSDEEYEADSETDSLEPKTPAEVMEEIAELVDDDPMVNYGARRQGRAHGEFWMRFPRSKDQEEAEQTLSDTSALLFDSARGAQEQARAEDPGNTTEDANNREIQGMLINDRLVFASNYNSSLDTLRDRGRRAAGGQEPTLQQLLDIRQSDAGATAGLRRHEADNQRQKLATLRRKNQAIVSGQRGDGEQGRGEDATAKALRAKLGAPVIVVDIEDENLREYLTSRKYEGRAFLLRHRALDPRAKKSGPNAGQPTAEGSLHAEQKLLLALKEARIKPHEDVRGPIAIMGKYRPCMGCAAALQYYRERLGFEDLSFDENYGHYFQSSVNGLYEHQRHILDEHYLEYIRQMVEEDITSTPAMRNEAAPEGAVNRNGGPSLRVPGRYASRQADVTPPTSDAEFDDKGKYRRTKVPLNDTWTVDTAPAGIGQGSATFNAPRRKHEFLDEAEVAHLSALWNGGAGRPPTRQDRQQALELAHDYKNKERMTLKYLGGVIGLHPNRLGGYLTRYGKEGHWNQVPTRSGKVQSGPKDRKKGDPAKQFTKGGALDQEGRDILTATLRSLAKEKWAADWARVHNSGAEEELNPTSAPGELLRTLAGLLRDRGYDVPSMSKFLHTGANGDKLRKAITRKGKPLLEQKEPAISTKRREEPEAVEEDAMETDLFEEGEVEGHAGGDVEMGGTSSGAGSYGPGPGEASSSSNVPRPPAQVPGYTLHIAPNGQAYYTDDDEPEAVYVRVDGRMTRLRPDEDHDHDMGGV
ncbi:DUF4157 domain-containing protein [Streptomyces sp. NPDC003717]|uniref:eCIS core domain-containing protein n=1 Tax=Streptomyces sp. NPDC003717 TaxID=3154276 RepID=UPI0033A203FB